MSCLWKIKIMTRNNFNKKAIRSRMEQTGEAYNVARRAIELSQTIVWELGEHGGSWFIEGTADNEIALEALKLWLLETAPDTLKDYTPFNQRLSLQFREDWYWKPIRPEFPKEEAFLTNLDKEPQTGESYKTFKGFYIGEK